VLVLKGNPGVVVTCNLLEYRLLLSSCIGKYSWCQDYIMMQGHTVSEF